MPAWSMLPTDIQAAPTSLITRLILEHARREKEPIAACLLARSILRHDDRWPFYMVTLIFVSAFGTLALSFWPYMIPFAITINSGAAPHSSLAFMFWGAGIFVYPLMLLYAVVGYRVFRGKLELTPDHHLGSGNAHLEASVAPHPAE